MVAVHYKDILPLRQAKVSAISAMMLDHHDNDDISSCERTPPRRKKRVQSKKPPRKQGGAHDIPSQHGGSHDTSSHNSGSNSKLLPRRKSSRHTNRDTFPVKLWKLLEGGHWEEAIRWTSDGKEFVIRNKTLLEQVLPNAGFAHSGLRSFHRQLSYWCFTRRCKDSNEEVWLHPHFFKGMSRAALASVIRISHKGNPVRRKGMTLEESAAHDAAIMMVMGDDEEEVSTSGTTSTSSSSYSSWNTTGMTINKTKTTTKEAMIIKDEKEEQATSPITTLSRIHNTTMMKDKSLLVVDFQQQQSMILQPRRIDFQDDILTTLDLSTNLMSPEEQESALFLFVTVPPAPQDDKISPTIVNKDTPSFFVEGFNHHELERFDHDSSPCGSSWVSPIPEWDDDDVLQILPINDTGTVSLSDEEDCMSLQDFSFLEAESTMLTADV